MNLKIKLIAASLSMVTIAATASVPADKTVLRDCQFLNKNAGSKVLDKEAFEQSGGYFHLWQNNNTSNQKFTLTYTGNHSKGKSWHISVQHSGQCLHTSSDTNGSRATQYSCPSWADWVLDGLTKNNGYYIIRSPFNSNYVLDVKHQSTKNGADVHVWTYHGGNSQQWRLIGCRDLDGHLVTPAV